MVHLFYITCRGFQRMGYMKLKFIDRQLGNVSFALTSFVMIAVLLLFSLNALICLRHTYNRELEIAHDNSEYSLISAKQILEYRMNLITQLADGAAGLSGMITDDPRSPFELLHHLHTICPDIMASCMMFRENYYPSEGREYSPQVYIDLNTGETVEYDAVDYGFTYLQADDNWIHSSAGAKYWSKAYRHRFREGGYLFCYSVPFYDAQGEFVGILCAQVDIDLLDEIMEAVKPDVESGYLILDMEGNILCCSRMELEMKLPIDEYAARQSDSGFVKLAGEMMDGGSGMIILKSLRSFVYYAPLDMAGFSISFSYPEESVLSHPRSLVKTLLLICCVVFVFLSVLLFLGMMRIISPFSKRFRSVTRKQAELDRDLTISAEIQKYMLPSVFPAFPDRDDLDVYAVLKPARLVGGDLYDFFIRDERLFFCLGDVSGKGVAASLFMSMVRSMFHSISIYDSNPGSIVSEMNKEMCINNRHSMFCTCFIGVLNLQTGELQYCNAGHNPPMLLGSDSAAQAVGGSEDIPVGMYDDEEYETHAFAMAAGDMLFLYTDGVTEAENASHDMLGEEKLVRILENRHSDTAQDIVEEVLAAVGKFTDGAEQSDDITMLAVRYKSSESIDITQVSLGET